MRRTLATVTVACIVVVAAAACGSPTPGGNPPPGTNTSSGNGVLGDGATTTPPAVTATTTPPVVTTTTPAVPPPTLGPVTHAALPNKSGYVWDSSPGSPVFAATGPYDYNSTGGVNSIEHTSPGQWTITYGGLATTGGVAHVSAYGNNSNFCNVRDWFASGADEKVEVVCFDHTTSFVDSTFVANFASGNMPGTGAHFSYLWNDKASVSGQHVPSTFYRYDSTGRDPWISRIGTGIYRVYIPASFDEQSEPYTFQVTAYGLATFRCHLAAAFVGVAIHEVRCWDATGTPYDSQFSLTYSAQASIIGRTDLRYGDYTQAGPGVTSSGTGVYTVTANEMGAARGQVVVDARGNTGNYCHVSNWTTSGSDLKMVARCFSPSGTPVNSGFNLGVTW